MKTFLQRLTLALTAGTSLEARPFLVENGEPRAEILLSETPTRTQRLAAHEFREQIEKISGARLPIRTQPSGAAVKVFIGDSESNPVSAADSTQDLKWGAYRIKSGEDWLALVGDDRDFTPPEPFARNNGDIPRAQTEWESIVGAPYGMINPGLYKNRLRLPPDTGLPDGSEFHPNDRFEIWGLDERGSFNAVCGFLRHLGTRWFMPGDLGEVLPKMDSIALPELDETVHPDFRLRQFNFRFGNVGLDTAMWAMRLGIRNDASLHIAHGLARMTNREEVFAEHPDWFAIYGGKTDFKPGDSKCQLCYSNEELLKETIRYTRTLFDTYPLETVSIMPPDGYTSICQCPECEGKDSPERHERGRLSNHVWDFVNQVAKEVAKTHPDRRILNCAYGVYTLPPDNIDRLEPNVQVCIVGGRRPINKAGIKGEGVVAPETLRTAWSKMTDHPLLVFENFPFTDRGWYLPSFSARALVETVRATRGVSNGEDIWLSAGRDFATQDIGFNHFLVYFTARAYWGGDDTTAEGLFDEYCRLFYGPAHQEIRAFFEFGETHWKAMENDQALAQEALDLFELAKDKAAAGSVEAHRLATIDDFLSGLRQKVEQLGMKRGPVPFVRLIGEAEGIEIDGHLDDAYWQSCPSASTGRLRELQTGGSPTFHTRFKTGWKGTNLYFAIHCEERPGERPNNAATEDDDPALWYGDAIELLIGTESHSYYQIAISPSGAVADLDRAASERGDIRWDSKAEVATRIEEDHWTVEIRLPITMDENDPLNQIIGRKPTLSLPWYLNLCRQRVREDGTELSALSPTGTDRFHDAMKFGHFYAGQSHRFEADPAVTDFALGFVQATRDRKADAFLELAQTAGITDFQRSAALEQAASFARDAESVSKILEQIPLEPVKKSVQMQALLDQREPAELIARFDSEDFAAWPFWKRGDGLFLRGRAHADTGNGEAAERDLAAAVEWTGDPKRRQSVLLQLGRNREQHLQDDAGALAAYLEVVEDRERIGGSDEFAALQAAARLLSEGGRNDEALAQLERIDTTSMRGTWLHSTLLLRADVLSATGEIEKAQALYRAVIDDPEAGERFKEEARSKLTEF